MIFQFRNLHNIIEYNSDFLKILKQSKTNVIDCIVLTESNYNCRY